MGYIAKCPKCKQVLHMGGGSPWKEINTPVKRCRHCGSFYIDQNMYEWCVLDPAYKFWYYFFANNRFLPWFILLMLCYENVLYLLIGGPIWMLICYAWVNATSKKAILASYLRCKDNPEYLQLLRESDYDKLAQQFQHEPTRTKQAVQNAPTSVEPGHPAGDTEDEISEPKFLSPNCTELTEGQLEYLAIKWGVTLDVAKKLVDYERLKLKLSPIYDKPETPAQAPHGTTHVPKPGKYVKPSSGNRGQKGKLPIAVMAVTLCFVIIISLLPYFFPTASSGSDDPSVSDAAIESAASSTKPSLPKNQSASAGKRTYTPVKAEDGELLICPSYEQICPFKIVVSYSDQQNKDFFVFLEYVCPFPEGSSEKDVVSFVEKGGLYSSATDTRTQSKLQEWKARNKPSIPVVDDIGVYLSTSTAFSFDVPPGCYRIWYCSGETWYGLNHYFGDNTVWHTSDDILAFYYDSEYVYGQTISLMLVADGNFDTYIASDSELPDALK